jgi:hypothetical protein
LAWAIKVTDEHAAWFTTMIKEDLAPATQVAQAVPALRERWARARPSLSRPAQGLNNPPPQRTAPRITRPLRDQDHLRVRLRAVGTAVGSDKAGNWQRWYRDNIPIAERLYRDYTTENQE